MSPKRGDDIAPPAAGGAWKFRYGTNDAITGWKNLCAQAPENTEKAWLEIRTNPGPRPPSSRHHQLKGDLSTAQRRGSDQQLPQWQYEVTGGGRIWYLIDADAHTIWLVTATTGHPKLTE